MLGSLVHKLVAAAEADAAKVKAVLLKAVQEIDGVILPEAEKVEPVIASLAQQIVPGGGVIVNTAFSMFEATAKLLDTGGAAAESNLLNAGLDSALIAAIKAYIPQLKAIATEQLKAIAAAPAPTGQGQGPGA